MRSGIDQIHHVTQLHIIYKGGESMGTIWALATAALSQLAEGAMLGASVYLVSRGTKA